MRLLILDAMRPHLNPNPSIIRSVVAAFRRALRPDCVCTADQWNLERVAAAEEPDAVIAFSSRIWPRLLAPLSALRWRSGTTVGWWLTDDPYEIDWNLDAAGLFDFVATNDRASAGAYWGTRVCHVPLAADPARHYRPVRKDDSAYERDVFFCGVPFPNRRAIVKAADRVLKQRKTLIVGPDWLRRPYTSVQRVDNTTLADLYNSSRIVLNLSRSYDLANTAGIPTSTPAPRTFEAAAAGGFQLVFADRPEIRDYFQVPGEIDLFASVDELETKIDTYLANPDERIAAAQRAQQRVLEHHTYAHRAQTILEQIRQLRGAARSGTTAGPENVPLRSPSAALSRNQTAGKPAR